MAILKSVRPGSAAHRPEAQTPPRTGVGLDSRGIRRAPVLKRPLKTSLGKMRLRQVLRHIGQAQSGQRRIEHLRSAVQDKLALDAHPQFAAAFFELPGV